MPRPDLNAYLHVPSPTGGLNTVDAASELPPKDAALLFNMVGAESGLRARLGYLEQATNLGSAIRTVIPFAGAAAGGANDKLFAAIAAGIYDVSTAGSLGPTLSSATPSAANGTLASGTRYYKVTAIIGALESMASNELSAVVTGPTGSVALVWTAVPGATGYRVYEGAGAGGENVYWLPGNVTAWTDTGTAGTAGTPPAAGPTLAIAFGINDATAGTGVALNFANSAGKFLIYTDESNGYFIRPEAGAWAQVAQGVGASQVSGVNPALFACVAAFKNRLWFVEKNSTRAWYLGLNSVYGAATAFDFGPQFTKGGQLAALGVWTRDGGSGSDDYLVAISTAGEVVLYGGIDPAQMGTFQKAGGWFVGGVPAGRRLFTTFGGELLILTSVGLLPISGLVAGQALLSPDSFSTRKVGNLFNAYMIDRRSNAGWSVIGHPVDNSIMITIPQIGAESPQQFALGFATRGWGLYQDLPMACADVWHGRVYFGTADGRVCINDGYIDNVTLDGVAAKQKVIVFGGITAFRSGGDSRQKQVHLIKPRLQTQGTPASIVALARYNFDLSPLTMALPGVTAPGNAFDTAKWDQTVFGGGGAVPFSQVNGSTGIGTHVAIAWLGAAIQRTVLIGFDLTVERGGFL